MAESNMEIEGLIEQLQIEKDKLQKKLKKKSGWLSWFKKDNHSEIQNEIDEITKRLEEIIQKKSNESQISEDKLTENTTIDDSISEEKAIEPETDVDKSTEEETIEDKSAEVKPNDKDIDEANSIFTQSPENTSVLRPELLQDSFHIFRYEIADIVNPGTKRILIDKLIKYLSYGIIEQINDPNGIADNALIAQAFFTLGVTLLDKAKLVGSNTFVPYAHNALIRGKELAEKANRAGLVLQLEGAIGQIKELHPDYEGTPKDCFIQENVDYYKRIEFLRTIFKNNQTISEKIEFDL